MVKRILPWLLLLTVSCSDLGGRAPVETEFDPAFKGDPQPGEKPSVENAELQSTSEAYEKRYEHGYPIHSGDELRFTVLGQAELSFEAKVPADGALSYPLIGQVALIGRTPEEVRLEIKERLDKDYLASSDVSVLVKEYSKKVVHVLGAVARPVICEVPGGRYVTLLQAVTQAGGFTEDAAKHSIVVFRRGQAYLFNAAPLERGLGRDPVLLPDDIVLVPARERVYVMGQVAHPGAFVADADRGLSASKAVALAGGFTRIANDENVRLLRRDKAGLQQTYVLDLRAVVSGKPQDDVPLQPGDLLFVPESVF